MSSKLEILDPNKDKYLLNFNANLYLALPVLVGSIKDLLQLQVWSHHSYNSLARHFA